MSSSELVGAFQILRQALSARLFFSDQVVTKALESDAARPDLALIAVGHLSNHFRGIEDETMETYMTERLEKRWNGHYLGTGVCG